MSSIESARREAAELLGLLAEEDRLRVVAALVLGAETTEEVTARAGLDRRVAVKALYRVRDGGLVEGDGFRWRLRSERLKEVVRAAAPRPDTDDHGSGDIAAAAVLRVFFKDGRLTLIPSARSKRLVVLDHVARVFEPGVRYTEAEVSATLRAFHPDYAALRRYLVDEGFMDRAGGVYWRSGGTVLLG